MKKCSKFKEEKLPDQFNKTKRTKSGLRSECKDCQASDEMNRLYGITIAQYDKMFEEQGGVCKICGTDDPGKGKGRFAIDHSHKTGKVRGLLCSSCNVGIGHLQDDPSILLSAFNYLKNEEESN